MNKPLLIIGFMFFTWFQTAMAQDIRWLHTYPQKINTATKFHIDSSITWSNTLRTQYPDSALKMLAILYKESQQHEYHLGMMRTLLGTGIIYMEDKKEPGSALFYLRKAYPELQLIQDEKRGQLIRWYNSMGAAFGSQGWNDSAICYISKALTLSLRYAPEDTRENLVMYINLGAIFKGMEEYDKAYFYMHKAEEVAIQHKYTDKLEIIYFNFISLSIAREDSVSTKIYLDKMARLEPTTKEWNNNLNFLFGTNYVLKQPRKAILYLKAVLSSGTNNIGLLRNTCFNLGKAYYFQKKYALSAHYYETALKKSLSSGIQGAFLLPIYHDLSVVYKSLGRHQEAYQYVILAAQLQDSINTVAKLKNADELDIRYRNAEKDQEITHKRLQLLSAENQLNKNKLWIRGIASAGIILLLSGGYLFQRQRLNLQRAKTREEQQKVEQLKAVIEGEEKERSRIGQQLHDDIMVEFSIARMNLETLPRQYPEIRNIEDFQNVVQQLNKANIKLRQAAHNLMPDLLMEEGLVTALAYFCRGVIQITTLKLDFQHYGDLPRLPIATEITLYRILQELVQNCIKHADAKEILIQLEYENGYLSLTVEDDGKGMPLVLDPTKGLGLKSIRNKLKALGGNMAIHTCDPQGTAIQIELNV